MKLLITVFVVFLLWHNYKKGKLISSSTIWVACYWLIFVLYPLYGLEWPTNNSGLIDLYALLGVVFFCIGQFFIESKKNNSYPNKSKQYRFPVFSISAFSFFIVTFLAIVSFISLYGASTVQDILVGSMTSKMIKSDFRGESAGLEQILLQFMMPTALATWVSAKSKKQILLKVISLLVFIVVQAVFNFTRIFLISYLVVIMLYELRDKEKNKQVIVLTGGVVIIVALMVTMNFVRTFGFGERLDSERSTDLSYIFESTDFGASYYWFDQLLDYGYPAIFPLAWLKPLFVFIPRSVWPAKPDKLSHDILLKLDPGLADSGYTTAGNSVLGEGYAILGVLGIVLFPLIWGYVCGFFDRRHYYRLKSGLSNCVSEILYYLFAVFIVLCIQRGDWSQYMITFIYWWIIPLLLISKKEEKTLGRN